MRVHSTGFPNHPASQYAMPSMLKDIGCLDISTGDAIARHEFDALGRTQFRDSGLDRPFPPVKQETGPAPAVIERDPQLAQVFASTALTQHIDLLFVHQLTESRQLQIKRNGNA